MSDNKSNPPRVAIKFGKSSSSSKKHTKSSNIRRHRAHALDDEESGSSGSEGDDRDTKHHGRHEVITDLDWSTTNEKDEKSHKRRHHSSRSDRHYSQEDRDSRRRDHDDDDRSNKPIKKEDSNEGESKQPVKFGLTINMRKGDKDPARKDSRDRHRSRSRSTSRSRTNKDRDDKKKAPTSLEDEAMDALLGNERPTKRKAPSDDPDRSPEPEDYRSVPIDDFGATLLKSLGWDGKMRGKVKEATPRHANLAGLGMKDAKGAEELTSWNQKAGVGGKKDSRPARLEDHAKEERNKRQRIEEKYGDSYKKERKRERERERGRHRET